MGFPSSLERGCDRFKRVEWVFLEFYIEVVS